MLYYRAHRRAARLLFSHQCLYLPRKTRGAQINRHNAILAKLMDIMGRDSAGTFALAYLLKNKLVIMLFERKIETHPPLACKFCDERVGREGLRNAEPAKPLETAQPAGRSERKQRLMHGGVKGNLAQRYALQCFRVRYCH